MAGDDLKRYRALDLFCGAGGVSVGLQRAGFDVTGIDINPQPHHRGGHFIQADALDVLQEIDFLLGFDFIWASPPCQAYTVARFCGKKTGYPELIEPVREALQRWGGAWVIENVPGAPLHRPALLCGLALGLKVKRHRLFESSFFILTPPCPKGHPGEWFTVFGNGGTGPSRRPRWRTGDEAQQAMGIDWMPRKALSQAIPPAYAEWIGRQALACLRETDVRRVS